MTLTDPFIRNRALLAYEKPDSQLRLRIEGVIKILENVMAGTLAPELAVADLESVYMCFHPYKR